MKKLFIHTFFLVQLVGCAGISHVNPKSTLPKQVQTPFPTLTPKDVPPPTVAWSDEVNFKTLRETFGLRSDFSQLCEREYPAKKINDSFDSGNFKEGVDLGNLWLNHCPVDSRIHTLVAYGYHQLGNETTAVIHLKWREGLIKSILASGDGKFETPYITISINEEYAVLRWLDLKPKQQMLLTGPPELDAITAIDESGVEKTLYFNPYLHFVRLYEFVKSEGKSK